MVLWFARRVGTAIWAIALGLLLAGIAGNLTDRIFRDPGPLRGHVVDLFMIPHWPVFNVADICIDVAAVLILLQAFRSVRLDGSHPTRQLPEETRVTAVDHRALMVPEGLAGERMDAAMARLFGLSRTPGGRPDQRRPRLDRRRRGGQERPVGAGHHARGRHPVAGRPARGACPRSSRASGSSTTTTRSW